MVVERFGGRGGAEVDGLVDACGLRLSAVGDGVRGVVGRALAGPGDQDLVSLADDEVREGPGGGLGGVGVTGVFVVAGGEVVAVVGVVVALRGPVGADRGEGRIAVVVVGDDPAVGVVRGPGVGDA